MHVSELEDGVRFRWCRLLPTCAGDRAPPIPVCGPDVTQVEDLGTPEQLLQRVGE